MRLLHLIVPLLSFAFVAFAQEKSADDKPAAQPPAEAQPEKLKPGTGLDAKPGAMPHVNLNLKEKYVDVEATVCLTEGPLELIATVPSGKEHEAVLTIKARPPHIHVCLLMLGAQSGSPGKWTYVNKVPKPTDPTGDKVKVTAIYEKDGKQVQRPVGELVVDRKSGKAFAPSEFVFAGSRVVKPEGGDPFYGAEVTGDVITLVSFEDEMLAAPKAASSANDDLQWEAATKELPPVGTKVTLRMQVVK